MREANQICLRSFRWMIAHSVWFKGFQRETYVNYFRPLLVFVMFQRFFSSLAFIADAIYDFFLGWRILCFHLLIKSNLLVGGLLRLDNKQNNTWSLVKFGISLLVFNWTSHEWARWAQRSLVRHQAEYYGFLPSLQVLVVVIFIFERPQYWRASFTFAFNFLCFVRLSNFFFGKVYLKQSSFISPSLFHQLKGNAKTVIERKNGPHILAFQQIRISIGDCGRRKMFS